MNGIVTTTGTYRGWSIYRTDTGGQRMGRLVCWFGTRDSDGRKMSAPTRAELKVRIDIVEAKS